MARGFNYAPGASAEVTEARAAGVGRDRLLQLVTSRNALVREEIARRDDLSMGLMLTLADDRSADVRAAIAANPRLSPALLEQLAADRQVPVLLAVVANEATPREVVERLVHHRRDVVSDAARERLAAIATTQQESSWYEPPAPTIRLYDPEG